MKTIYRITGIILILVSFLGTNTIQAQRSEDKRSRGTNTHRNYNTKQSVGTNHYRGDRYRTQPIHRNPYYRYPRRHRVIRTLPRHHVRVVYGGLPYFYYAGIYYTVYNNAYVTVLPPVGFRITVLPAGYTRLVVGPSIYYYHSGVYYANTSEPYSDEQKYEVTHPLVGTLLKTIHDDAEEVVIDGKIFYDYNNVLYKKVSTFDGNTAYEVVHVHKENK